MPTGAWLSIPSSRCRMTSASGSRSCSRSDIHSASFAAIAARNSSRSIESSSMDATRPRVSRDRYDTSPPTTWRMVSMIVPYVPGADAWSCSGESARQASVNRTVAQTWCPNASANRGLVIARTVPSGTRRQAVRPSRAAGSLGGQEGYGAMPSTRHEKLAAAVRADRTSWQELVSEVARDRMNEPGPMGDWTFKDLAGHLAGWRNYRIAQFEAVARGE